MNHPFEQHIKQSLENYEVPYNPSDWADLQKRLNTVKSGKPSGMGKKLMIAASVAAVAGVIYYFSTTGSENNKPENAVATSQNMVQHEVKENSIQKNEEKNQPHVITQPTLTNKDHSSKEKVIATTNAVDEKSSVLEKTEIQNTNNVVENKTSNQEKVQTPSIEPPTPNLAVLHASFHSDLNQVCEGVPVQFMTDYTDASSAYKWSFGDGTSSVEQNPKHSYADAGTYSVKLRVTSVKDKKNDEQKNTITVLAAPSLKMNYSASNNDDFVINFDANADKITEWKWDFGDKQSSAEQNPIHTYGKKGNYPVSVTAKNSFGCTATVKQTVTVENNLFAPTAFSPNGDGKNDTWIPLAFTVGDKIFTLTIYDKSGVVFTTSDKNNPWDGANAKLGDTFIWKATVKEKNGENSHYDGLITIKE